MAIRGILFDKDGTIVDYWRTWLPINHEVALYAAGGDRQLADELLRLGGQDPRTGRVEPGSPLAAGGIADIAAVFAAHPAVRPPAGFEMHIDRIFASGGARHSVLVDGARATLAALRERGFKLGLATNDSVAGLEASLARHAVLPLFDFTAGCDSGHGAKPGPGMVLAFCKAVGLRPGEVAVVGDAVHDLAMGRAAGAGLTIGVLSGTSAPADLEGWADRIIDSVNDLLALPELVRVG
jgi:phosphoglycolate phosphatase